MIDANKKRFFLDAKKTTHLQWLIVQKHHLKSKPTQLLSDISPLDCITTKYSGSNTIMVLFKVR